MSGRGQSNVGAALPDSGASLRRAGVIGLRVVLLSLGTVAAANIAAALPAGGSIAELFRTVVSHPLSDWFLSYPSPARVGSALADTPLPALLLLGAVWAAMITAVVRLRPGACIGLGLAACLLQATLQRNGADLWGDLSQASWLPLALAACLYGTVLVVCSLRWAVLLRIQAVDVEIPTLIRLTLIGSFFNLALPGAVSGDVLKMAYVTKHAHGRKAEAVLTIVLDRIVGLLGLFVFSTLLLLVLFPVLRQLPSDAVVVRAAVLAVGSASAAGMLGVLAVECRETLLRIAVVRRLTGVVARLAPTRVLELVKRLTAAIELCRCRRVAMAKALALAVLVHIMLGCSLYLIGRALGETRVPGRAYLMTMQVANIAGSVPITPGGLGTRDAAAAALLHAFRADPPDVVGSIPVALSLIMVLWGLVGAAVFVLGAPVPQPRPGAPDGLSPGDVPPDTEDKA